MAGDQGSSRNGAAERITVGLIIKAAEDLRNTQERTGLSKTDIVNRAVSLYEFIDAAQSSGDEIILRRKSSGNLEIVRLL